MVDKQTTPAHMALFKRMLEWAYRHTPGIAARRKKVALRSEKTEEASGVDGASKRGEFRVDPTDRHSVQKTIADAMTLEHALKRAGGNEKARHTLAITPE